MKGCVDGLLVGPKKPALQEMKGQAHHQLSVCVCVCVCVCERERDRAPDCLTDEFLRRSKQVFKTEFRGGPDPGGPGDQGDV